MFLSPFFKVGDLIECESIRGRVEDIGLLHTRIRGMDNQLISTPNATFVSSEVTNFSRRERRGESFVSRTFPKLLTDPNFFLSFLFFLPQVLRWEFALQRPRDIDKLLSITSEIRRKLGEREKVSLLLLADVLASDLALLRRSWTVWMGFQSPAFTSRTSLFVRWTLRCMSTSQRAR